MQEIDFKSLRLFVAICDHRHINAAAASEHIEPSAVSKRLAHLEDALGVRLLHRSRQGAVLTPAGEAILEHARNLLFTLGRLRADAQAFSRGIQGKVKLVASASAFAERLLDDTASFMRKPEHRGIKLEIEERPSSEVVRMVRDGNAALGVCWTQNDVGALSCHAYCSDQLVLCVPKGHPLAQLSSIRFEDSLPYEYVGMPPWSAVTRMLEQAAGQCGKRIDWRMVVSNFDGALRVVASGMAVTVFPLQAASTHSAQDRVEMIPLEDAWATRQFGIYTRDAETMSPAARLLLAHLIARAQEE